MLRGHPRLAAALARRGITDLSLVLTDVWAYGASLVPERYRGLRLGWSDVWCRGSEQGNPYAHHLSGLHPIVDLNRMELLELEDAPPGGDPTGRPEVMGEYLPKLIRSPAARRAAAARQPARGRLVHARRLPAVAGRTGGCGWASTTGKGWSCTPSGSPTTGASGRSRTGSRSPRWWSPTGTPPPTTTAGPRSTSASGASGFMTTSLELGCDCLGEITYLDAVVHDSPRRAAHDPERDLHPRGGQRGAVEARRPRVRREVRRARRLVVSFHVTVANYEYLVYWRFYQDGSIECEVRATGIMVTSHFPDGHQPPTGTLVDERTYAPFHQHFIVARLDLDVDGAGQHGLRDRVGGAARSTPATPTASPWWCGRRPLRTESEGRQDYDWQPAAGVEGRQRRASGMGSAARSATSSCRPAASRRCSTRVIPGAPASRRSSSTRSGSRRTARTSAGRAASSRT